MTHSGAGAVGRTKDAGWQIGVSKTLPYPVDTVWSVIVGEPSHWLGTAAVIPREKGEQWQSDDGTTGELRSRREGDRVRLTWRPPGWSHDTTVQVAVQATATGTVLRFHQERLAGPDERQRQRSHWQAALARIERALEQESGTA
ncbi:SRPBCC family protein [Rhodococcus phenolicus]|uniref:SRPBCC family protein n=1 Tax=Rhodococcus phenolicus TaxID=263849 RepID=UPI00082C1D86|nr:SRPBCC domain-containing protein [Rhodococcus phenolicus]